MSHHHHVSKKDQVPAFLQDLEKGLKGFIDNLPLDEYKKGDCKQNPLATMICCCDARSSAAVFGDPFNRVFCVENIGNQVRNAQGSIYYGLLHLNTPLMIVLGHTDCGAIKAAISEYAGEPDAIVKELDTVKNSLDRGKSSFAGSFEQEPGRMHLQLAELNVDVQVDALLKMPELQEPIKSGEVTVLGVVLDLHDLHGAGYGQLHTVNVNGEKDTAKIKAMSELGWFADQANRLT